MSTVLHDLGDCILTDTGEVIVSPEKLFERLRQGKPIDGLCTYRNIPLAMRDAIQHFLVRNPTKILRFAEVDNTPGQFPDHLYDWKIPDKYRDLDLVEHLVMLLEQQFPEMPQDYVDRVTLEYEMMMERGMEDFLRLIIYIMESLDREGIVHGLGRGSACASLVLYLIGVHMVDPILYDIPITEFLR